MSTAQWLTLGLIGLLELALGAWCAIQEWPMPLRWLTLTAGTFALVLAAAWTMAWGRF